MRSKEPPFAKSTSKQVHAEVMLALAAVLLVVSAQVSDGASPSASQRGARNTSGWPPDSAATVHASSPRGENYAPVTAQTVTGTRAANLDAAFAASTYASELKVSSWVTEFPKLARDFFAEPREWRRIPLPAPLESLLPGAGLYIMRGAGYRRELFGRRGAKLYHLPSELNILLSDCGMRFVDSDVPAWIRLTVFVLMAAREFEVLASEAGNTGWFPPSIGKMDSIVTGARPVVPGYSIDSTIVWVATRGPAERGLNAAQDSVVMLTVWLHSGEWSDTLRILTETIRAPRRTVIPEIVQGGDIRMRYWLELPRWSSRTGEGDVQLGIGGDVYQEDRYWCSIAEDADGLSGTLPDFRCSP